MKIAIVDKSSEFQLHRLASAYKRVLHISGVLAMTHPDAFFENRIANGKSPNRRSSVQPKAFDMRIPVRLDCSAAPAICSQRIIRCIVMNHFVEFGYKLHAPYRWLKRSYQQAMIATGEIATHGTRSESPNAISD